MAENKYGKYVLRNPIGRTPHMEVLYPIVSMVNIKQWENSNVSFRISTITSPFIMETKSHAHEYDAYMCFLGGNPTNFKEFGAEIEFSLGEEHEVQKFNEPTVVYVPKGLAHGPLNFKRVDKPIMFLHIFMSADYAKKQV
jgi:hypothetical protein